MSKTLRSQLVFAAVVVGLIAAIYGAFQWAKHVGERMEEDGRARFVAGFIESAKESGRLHLPYKHAVEADWRRIREMGHLDHFSCYQWDAPVDARAVLKNVDAHELEIWNCRIDLENEGERLPTNETIRTLRLHHVRFDGDPVRFLAAMPRLETVQLSGKLDADEYDVLERGLTNAPGLKQLIVHNAELGARLQERFGEVGVSVSDWDPAP